MVTLTIDGKDVTVAKGSTILEAARQLGIKIPTLCWLQKVSPTGACRVCAVEIEGVDRTMTACNTPVKDGIKVITQSENLTEIRKKVMELMLVNHPLDCPVCDAAGECDLQNCTYGLEATKPLYSANLEKHQIRYDWPLIESDPNRCILCEKCVKVDHEVVGCDAIHVVNRGDSTIIDTVDGKPLNCEFCGNCIGVCPTGTLISKPFKFRGRPWTFSVTKSVCGFCSTGCQIEYHSRNNRVERVTSDDSTYNNGNICINGRFGYSYLNSPDRLTVPLLNQSKADWNSAMDFAVKKLKEIVASDGADAVAGIGSPRVTNEESYLFQKFLRNAVGTANIDSEARFGYAAAKELLWNRLGGAGCGPTIDRIDNADAVIVIGSDLNAESTGIEYRVIKAAIKNDARLILAHTRNVKLNKFANTHLKYKPGAEAALVAALIKAIIENNAENTEFVAAKTSGIESLKSSLAGQQLSALAATAGVSEADLNQAAAYLKGKKNVMVLFGADVIRSASRENAVGAIADLSLLLGCPTAENGGVIAIEQKNNIQGMLDMGVSPNFLPGYKPAAKPGKDLWQIIDGIESGAIKALYIIGCDPLASFPDNAKIRAALAKLQLLVVQDIAAGDLTAMAHVVLPGAAAAEKSGSFTTPDNRVQCLTRAVTPPGEAREDWDIIAELISRYTGEPHARMVSEITAELKEISGLYAGTCSMVDGRCSGLEKQRAPLPAVFAFAQQVQISAAAATDSQTPFVLSVGAIGFHNGTMSTRSENNLSVSPKGYVEIATEDAARLAITEGTAVKLTSPNGSISGTAKLNAGLPSGLVFAPHHFRDLNASSLLARTGNLAGVKVEKI